MQINSAPRVQAPDILGVVERCGKPREYACFCNEENWQQERQHAVRYHVRVWHFEHSMMPTSPGWRPWSITQVISGLQQPTVRCYEFTDRLTLSLNSAALRSPLSNYWEPDSGRHPQGELLSYPGIDRVPWSIPGYLPDTKPSYASYGPTIYQEWENTVGIKETTPRTSGKGASVAMHRLHFQNLGMPSHEPHLQDHPMESWVYIEPILKDGCEYDQCRQLF